MYTQTDKRNKESSVGASGSGILAAPFITIPRLSLSTELCSHRNTARLIQILERIGQYIDIESLLVNDYSPFSVLKKSISQWFDEILSGGIASTLDFEVDFITQETGSNDSDFGLELTEDEYILLFRMNTPAVNEFDIENAIIRYEKEQPGLGQKILRHIEHVSPMLIGTPRYLVDSMRDYFWRGYDTEDEFICDMWGDCDEEEREYILDELPITTDRIRENFEEWILNPDESLFCGTVPEELETLFYLTEKRHRFMEYPYSDNLLPGIIPWQNDMLFDCVDRMCSEQMNDGRTIIYNGVFWRIPANGENLSEILAEINDTARDVANLLQIIHEIHNSEDLRNGCCNPQ